MQVRNWRVSQNPSLCPSKYTTKKSLQIELVNMLIYYPEVFKIHMILKWKIHKNHNRKFSLSYSLCDFVWDFQSTCEGCSRFLPACLQVLPGSLYVLASFKIFDQLKNLIVFIPIQLSTVQLNLLSLTQHRFYFNSTNYSYTHATCFDFTYAILQSVNAKISQGKILPKHAAYI